MLVVRRAHLDPVLRPGGAPRPPRTAVCTLAPLARSVRAHPCMPHAQTCNFDTLYAYLSTANYDFSYDRAKNLRPKRNIKTAMNNEIMLYGAHRDTKLLGSILVASRPSFTLAPISDQVLPKRSSLVSTVSFCPSNPAPRHSDPSRAARSPSVSLQRAEAVEECKYRMSRYGVSPNMLVLPPQVIPSASNQHLRARLTKAFGMCTDAALHGARARVQAHVQGGRPRGRGALRGGRGGLRGALLPRLRRLHLRAGALSSNPRLSLGLAF